MGDSLHYSTLLLSSVLIGLIVLAFMPFIAVSMVVFMDVLADVKATTHGLVACGWMKAKRSSHGDDTTHTMLD
jgi:hypothetical protein